MSQYSFGQFVEISKSNLHLKLYRGFLEVSQKKELLGRIPLDDILGVVITGHGCSHSSNILVTLAEKGIPISICGSNFLPKALILPVEGNCKQSLRMQAQANMSKPFKKKTWKKVIQWKLKNQASVLKQIGLPYKYLLSMSAMVQSGDPENLEAQGARRYWVSLFSKKFKRDTKEAGINSMLNYAYAIIRSCVARGIVTSGLHPSLGIHHKNIYNPMCLVDDLMEPFRPIADYVVKQLVSQNHSVVDREIKQILARIAVVDVKGQKGQGPLFYWISRYATELAMVICEEKSEWEPFFEWDWSYFNVDKLRVEQIPSVA